MQERGLRRTKMQGLIAVGLFFVVAGQAQAQTTSSGPYYAMPSWDQTLPAATRFIILSNFSSQAVLDRETGLVWEQTPATTRVSQGSAISGCTKKTVGGRKGWRLPSIAELSSLMDPSVAVPGMTLPAGHPFDVKPDTGHWSASTNAESPSTGWVANFSSGAVGTADKAGVALSWCVRGGMHGGGY